MRNSRTPILAVIAVLSAIAALAAYGRLEKLRGNAFAGERDLGIVHRDLMAITQANGGTQIALVSVDSNELTRRLNSAAVIAGVRDQLVDIDPGAPARVENSEYNELPVILRFEKITLQQLTVFFHQLAVNDPGSRAKTIELAPPEASGSLAQRTITPTGGTGQELWTADVTVAYLMYAPKEAKPAR